MKHIINPTLYLIISMLLIFSGKMQAKEIRMLPVMIENKSVQLEVIIYKPTSSLSVFPTLVLNHGSTGRGTNPSYFKREIYHFGPTIEHFVNIGWAVVVPMRRGRGGSEGLYDEGFNKNRSRGYSCETARALKGADRALADIDALMNAIITMPFVDKNRLIIGGASRGGILSVAYAGQHPERVKGVINFVGGWIAEVCPNADAINGSLFSKGVTAMIPTLWLYADNDPYYSIKHSRKNFQRYLSQGGEGEFHDLKLANNISGHALNQYPKKWSVLLDNYLKTLGLGASVRPLL